MNDSNLKYQIIYDIVSAENNVLNIKELCEIAGVSRSGYYTWVNAEPKRIQRDLQDQKDFELILKAFQYRGYDKGVRGIHMRLLHTGIRMNQKKIRRLMRKYNLSCPVRKQNPYRQMIRAMKTNSISDNLVNREFKEHGPRTILLTDITYIKLNDDFIYLSVIFDAYTKEVLSYVLSELSSPSSFPSFSIDILYKMFHSIRARQLRFPLHSLSFAFHSLFCFSRRTL